MLHTVPSVDIKSSKNTVYGIKIRSNVTILRSSFVSIEQMNIRRIPVLSSMYSRQERVPDAEPVGCSLLMYIRSGFYLLSRMEGVGQNLLGGVAGGTAPFI